MRAVDWSSDALDDFSAAIDYLARQNEQAAGAMAERIFAAIERLVDLPTGHQGRVKGTYEKLARNTPYIVAYAMTERRITILRIIHGARDWPDDAWPED